MILRLYFTYHWYPSPLFGEQLDRFPCCLLTLFYLFCNSCPEGVPPYGHECHRVHQGHPVAQDQSRQRLRPESPNPGAGRVCCGGPGKGHIWKDVPLVSHEDQQSSGQDQETGSLLHWHPWHRWIWDLWGELFRAWQIDSYAWFIQFYELEAGTNQFL